MIIDLLGRFLPRSVGLVDSCFPAESNPLLKNGISQGKQACSAGDDDWHQLKVDVGGSFTESCSSTELSISDDSIECRFFSSTPPKLVVIATEDESPGASPKEDPPASDSDETHLPQLATKRSRELPGTWYYSSNHIMVNTERTKNKVHPLTRKSELDAVARSHAQDMACKDHLYHTTSSELQRRIGRPCRRIGVNVFRGENIRAMHNEMILSPSDARNMLDDRYFEFGMATARGPSGDLLLCQIFIG
jgi:Cysteine-rich secretory protein family